MRRMALALVVTAGLVAVPAAATAAIDAATFAADCDDGSVAITSNLTVRGGVGTITGLCFVSMAPGTRLRMVDTSLAGSGGLIFTGTLAGSTITVVRTTIDLDGAVQLAAGCCSGEANIDESGATVVVRDSSVTGDSVEVSGSTADDDGRARVVRSRLEATGSLGVAVHASTSGDSGSVRVIDSELVSAGSIDLRTGPGGRTLARRNAFSAVGTVTITGGATCASSGNVPPTPCS